MPGHHHDQHGDALTTAARDALEAAGEQWTPMRGDVFAVLAALDRPSSAYEIADSVSQQRSKRVAPNSVYRILDLFVARNLARKIESANAFIANRHPGCVHDCIFLICDGCGSTRHIDDDSVAGEVRRLAGDTGFSVARPVIEVRGRCAACAG